MATRNRSTPVDTSVRAVSKKKAKLDPKEVLTLVLAHGSAKQGGELMPVGTTFQMTRAEHQHVDPTGTTFVSESKWAAMQMKAEAEDVIASADDAPADEAE